jgi:hypothetical protein
MRDDEIELEREFLHNDGITEAEAQTKWCFQTAGTGASQRCLASICMAWRWAGNNGEWERRKPDNALLTPLPVGFCGLAELRAIIIRQG